jgi:hypothetical protein
MKCLTVKQPWATLLVQGASQYLVSSWRTCHRGRLAIHASSRFPRAHIELCCDGDMRRLLHRHGYDFAIELPMQAVLGSVTIADCLRVTEETREFFDPDDPAVAFGLVQPGRWVWICTGPESFPHPVPAVGRPGIFAVPDAVACGSRLDDSTDRGPI